MVREEHIKQKVLGERHRLVIYKVGIVLLNPRARFWSQTGVDDVRERCKVRCWTRLMMKILRIPSHRPGTFEHDLLRGYV